MPDISEKRFEEAIERALPLFGPDAYPDGVHRYFLRPEFAKQYLGHPQSFAIP